MQERGDGGGGTHRHSSDVGGASFSLRERRATLQGWCWRLPATGVVDCVAV